MAITSKESKFRLHFESTLFITKPIKPLVRIILFPSVEISPVRMASLGVILRTLRDNGIRLNDRDKLDVFKEDKHFLYNKFTDAFDSV